MRKINSGQQNQAQVIDLTPMLDVVFILLIFFIVTASFIKSPGIEVYRTLTVSADQKKPAILVGINDQNQIWIDKHLVNDNVVKLRLVSLRAENPRGTLVIQIDGEAAIGKLALVADIAREIGITNISVSTFNE
jgi:biopolymer transport protein ExbD